MQDLVLALTLVVCLFTDLKQRKIYNKVIFPVLIFGIIYNIVTAGLPGLYQSLLGMAAGLGILIIPFALGGMGAGDVKLLAVIGAVKGPLFVLYAAIGMALAGGILALVVLAYKGMLFQSIRIFLRGIWLMIISRFRVFQFDFGDSDKIMLPYGFAIAIGAVSAYWWMG